jgi:hypothetical protein
MFIAEESPKPRVFLSYSHKDKELIERVALLLKERSVDVWYDEWELKVGSSLIHEIQKGIQRADFIIIFVSENGANSVWMKEEYEASKMRQIETADKVKILPARLDDCDFPGLLTSRLYADFRHSFVFGFSELLKAIFGFSGMSPIDQTFEKYARLLDSHRQTSKTSPELLWTKAMDTMEIILKDRWKGACYSARDLRALAFTDEDLFSRSVREPDGYFIRKFGEYLGDTTRNYVQVLLYHEVIQYLSQKQETTAPNLLSLLLDHIYSRFNEYIHNFGLPQFRNAESAMIGDIERIFSIVSE